MDVSIGHLRLVGRVVGAPERSHESAVVDLLTGTAARGRLLEALTAAFEGDEVVVIRSLTCAATVRLDGPGGTDTFAGSVAASAARLLRDHPADDDCVVRFADEAAYVAAYVHDLFEGRPDRWYYEALRTVGSSGRPDLAALLAARPAAVRWRILRDVRRRGELDALVELVGDEGAAGLVTGSRTPGGDAWTPLVTTATAIVRRATGLDAGAAPADLASALVVAEPPPDWQDPSSLGAAVAVATARLLAALEVEPDEDVARQLREAAAEHAWFDQTAFAAAIPVRRTATPAPRPPGVVDPVLSPRARQVLAALVVAVTDGRLTLDPTRPASPGNLVRLLGALVETDARWGDDELAPALAAQVLDRWAGGPRTPPERRTPWPRTAGDHDPVHTAAGPATSAAGGEVDDGDLPSSRRGGPVPSTRSVAEQLDVLFPRTGRHGVSRPAPSAAGLLVLRGALDLGLAPYLLDATASGRPLLTELLDRWGGAADPDDALRSLVADVAEAAPTMRDRLDDVAGLVAGRLLAQRTVSDRLGLMTVPHGPSGLARVVTDPSGRLLPWGSLDGGEWLPGLVAGAGASLAGEVDDTAARAGVSGTLAAVHLVTRTSDELPLDLLAICCVQAWARWLPGFGGASVPFLLGTVVRRPAAVEVRTDEVVVVLPARSHDVVLQLAGYLDPVDPGTALGGRRVVFETGDGHGR